MSKNRYVNTSFWTDPYIENLDPSEKLIFLFLLTNPLTNISGVYEVSIKRIAYDTGFDKDMILKILERFEKDEKVYYFGGFIILPNFIKHQSLNSNVKKGIIANLDNIPDLVKASKGFQRLSKALKYFNLTLTKPNLTKLKPKLKIKKEIPSSTFSQNISETTELFKTVLTSLREKYPDTYDFKINVDRFNGEVAKFQEWGEKNEWTRKEGKKQVPIKDMKATVRAWLQREMEKLKTKPWEIE